MKRTALNIASGFMAVIGLGVLLLGAASLTLLEGEMQTGPADMTGIPLYTADLSSLEPAGTVLPPAGSITSPKSPDEWIFSTIPAGEMQITPGDSECKTAPPGWINYTVRDQDNLLHLSVLFGFSVPGIQAANCMGDSLEIHPGQTIFLPFLPTLATIDATTPSPPAAQTIETPAVTATFGPPTIISSWTHTPLAP